jgi:hypothetical protein
MIILIFLYLLNLINSATYSTQQPYDVTPSMTSISYNDYSYVSETTPPSDNGAVIINYDDDIVTSFLIINCNFENCISQYTGGAVTVYMKKDGEINFTSCNFARCFSRYYGGCISVHSDYLDFINSSLVITDCVFTECNGFIYI